jgi:hypothetical protein
MSVSEATVKFDELRRKISGTFARHYFLEDQQSIFGLSPADLCLRPFCPINFLLRATILSKQKIHDIVIIKVKDLDGMFKKSHESILTVY